MMPSLFSLAASPTWDNGSMSELPSASLAAQHRYGAPGEGLPIAVETNDMRTAAPGIAG
jgi:hypothetical protein